MRKGLFVFFGSLAIASLAGVADARDGCGQGYYFDGYRCRPMYREFGPPPYRERSYEDRGYGGPGSWRAIRGQNSYGDPEIWYAPRGGQCPRGFTIQDGVCKRYRGY